MKTHANFPENGSAITLDALIFANRNRAYGAYELRRKYKKHLLIGFAFAFLLFSSAISVPYIQARFFNNVNIAVPLTSDGHEISYIEDQVITPPPPPIDIPDASRIRYQAIFVVVDSVEDPFAQLIPVEEIIDGAEYPYEETALVPVNNPEDDIFDPDKKEGVLLVQENATFQGGDLGSFQMWVQSNVSYPVDAAQAGIQGKVYIEFCVNTKGNVCDVKILRGPHPSINDECMKTLMNSPKWNPAKQNGRLVKQKFTIPIQFILAS